MADNELERLISRYSQELLNYAKRSPSSGTENDEGDELRRFDDGFNALEDLRDRESGAPADNDQSEPLNMQAKNNADTDFDDGTGGGNGMGGGNGTDDGNGTGGGTGMGAVSDRRPIIGAIINGAFGEATDEDTPPPIIIGDTMSQTGGISSNFGDSMSQMGSISPQSGDTMSQTDSISPQSGDTMSQTSGGATWPSDNMSQFTGGLEVSARTASDALPVEGVLVIVTSSDGDGGRFEQVALTDRSGLARVFNLPAANPENSQTPEGIDKYFLYSVNISKPGFYDMESRDIPLFGGVTSRQDFAMVPLPEGFPNETIENENTEPDNLR